MVSDTVAVSDILKHELYVHEVVEEGLEELRSK